MMWMMRCYGRGDWWQWNIMRRESVDLQMQIMSRAMRQSTSSQASRLPNILVRAGMRPGGFYSHVFGPAARISCLIFCTVDIINSSRPGTNYRLDIDEWSQQPTAEETTPQPRRDDNHLMRILRRISISIFIANDTGFQHPPLLQE